MPTLFQITRELVAWNDVLDEIGGDVTSPVAEAAIAEWYKELIGQEAEKLDGYVGLIKTLEMEAAAAQAEVEQWQAKARARRSRAEYLKAKLLEHMEHTNQVKIATASGRTIAAQQNGGLASMEVFEDMVADMPDEHVQTIRVPDREKIRQALNAGEPLPYARLLPKGRHLRIR
ncbi:MAG TPA: siphovirus Gp157 family protein [Gemmata sp.]|jgi:hypothetical protein|nr:siphovirus Gp157 family protein [Gemmata sp.]